MWRCGLLGIPTFQGVYAGSVFPSPGVCGALVMTESSAHPGNQPQTCGPGPRTRVQGLQTSFLGIIFSLLSAPWSPSALAFAYLLPSAWDTFLLYPSISASVLLPTGSLPSLSGPELGIFSGALCLITAQTALTALSIPFWISLMRLRQAHIWLGPVPSTELDHSGAV